ncbi:MAG: tRNA pseudouridine(13) synthase TruD [Halothiobacillaceae bacterium]|nr:tRNA pseudouridine(13) synthase TruD [Halothiobacillaceae bacterium]HER34392.1 tRNA pseudouridine(13) synthase TruD [Halothiobacillaceae bacterium]
MSEADPPPRASAPRDWLGAPDTTRPRVCGAPEWRAGLKATPESFRVDEVLGFGPAGAGNHWLVRLEKRDMTTGALVDWAGKATGTRSRDIGFSGLKDRHAVTTQWLSFPHETFDPEAFQSKCAEAGISVLELDRHDRKLRRGTHRSNRFQLTLNDVTPIETHGDDLPDYLDRRCTVLAEQGMANYFGTQRYGRGHSNLNGLVEWGTGQRSGTPKRSVRNWLISTLRSAIFDHVLATRLEAAKLQRVLPGDLLQLAGSRSRFLADGDELVTLQKRLETGDVTPTGPLWGEQGSEAGEGVADTETTLAGTMIDRLGGETWREWFVHWRVASDRRPLSVHVEDLSWRVEGRDVALAFSLPPGSYATELVAELFVPIEA